MKKLLLTMGLLIPTLTGTSQSISGCNKTIYEISVKKYPVDAGGTIHIISGYECIDIDTTITDNGFYKVPSLDGWVRSNLININNSEPNIGPYLPPECNFCTIEVDKFDGEVTYRGPHDFQIDLSKINNIKYLYLTSTSSYCTVDYDLKDIILLFRDGTKYTARSKYNTNTRSGGFVYSVMLVVDDQLSNLLKTKELEAYEIYIFDSTISTKKAEKIKKIANCIF